MDVFISLADRLCPGNDMVLLTKKKALEAVGRNEECYRVCNQLIEKGFQVN